VRGCREKRFRRKSPTREARGDHERSQAPEAGSIFFSPLRDLVGRACERGLCSGGRVKRRPPSFTILFDDATIEIHDDSTPTWAHARERRDWTTIDRVLRSATARAAVEEAAHALEPTASLEQLIRSALRLCR
jgi:hypothetical protein